MQIKDMKTAIFHLAEGVGWFYKRQGKLHSALAARDTVQC